MRLTRADGVTIWAPAQAVLKQFDKAKESLAENPKQITAWLPILQPLGPSLLSECESANSLSKALVENWLKKYMFKDRANKDELAASIASYLADSDLHFSHGRRIGIDDLKERGVTAIDLRETPPLRDAVWNLYHAISWTMQDTAAFKIIENGSGTAYIRQLIMQQLIPQGAIPAQQRPIPMPQPASFQQKKPRKRH